MVRKIPQDFTGLGYEISSIAVPGLLSAQNDVHVRLVRDLGTEGMIRIGGNTSDSAMYVKDGATVSAPHGTVVNDRSLKDLRSFLDATNWKAMWGLNLNSRDIKAAVTEALAVSSILGDRLHSLEIGNEPDHFGYTSYISYYRQYKAAIRERIPSSRFSGPDVAGATSWVESFAKDEGPDLSLLTEHYYIGDGNSDASTISVMLEPHGTLSSMLSRLEAVSNESKIPYRICETNSFYNGGRPGVSDTFGSALWVLDYMYTLCSMGAAGVNMETGLNHRGFVSSYSPIGDDGQGHPRPMPEYYGMLAFAQGSKGNLVYLTQETNGANLTSYAVSQEDQTVTVTIINKESSRDLRIVVTCDRKIRNASVVRLVAPTAQSQQEVTLGGASVSVDARWNPSVHEAVKVTAGMATLKVHSNSAAMVTVRF